MCIKENEDIYKQQTANSNAISAYILTETKK